MKIPTSKLTDQERQDLLEFLAQQQEIGPKSAEVSKMVLSDLKGNKYDLGEQSSGVIVDQNGIPHVFTEQRAIILDCGHSISDLSQVLGKCNFGHIICQKDKLMRCSRCRKIMCEFDMVERDGIIICTDCSRKQFWIIFGIIALPIVTSIIILLTL